MKKCSVENCSTGSQYYARGYCHTHYERWRKHGDPLIFIKSGPKSQSLVFNNASGKRSDFTQVGCKVKGCKKKHFCRGYCSAHYNKFLRYGNPLKVIRKPGGGWKQPEEVKKKIRENAKRGDKNSSWKGGVRIYRKMALKKYDNKCSICGVKEPIIVHHKDGNRKNNKIENLEILCLNCHWKKHQDLKTQKESFSISGY